MRSTFTFRGRTLPAGRYLVDAAIAGALVSVSILLGQESQAAGWRDFDAVACALTVAINLPIVLRRRFPMAVLVGVAVLWVLFIAAGYWPLVNSNAAMVALYTVASRCPPRVTLLGALTVTGVWIYGQQATHRGSLASVIVQGVFFSAVLWKFGDSERRLVGLTAALRREQHERARRAITEERLRIARELHDVVAHHMSVVSVQAGLARFVHETDPSASRTALQTVSDTSSEALAELRRILSLLRITQDDGQPADPGHDPAPGLDRVDQLVDRIRAVGVTVELVVIGTARPLAAGLDLCVYRVIQEALTNVLKHAGPAKATVTLEYRAREITARITDDGAGHPAGPGEGSGGHGLLGMRERVRIYAGTITAGPRAAGGYEVAVTLPTAVRV